MIDREALARALYETDAGSNGYPPLHLSIPWEDTIHSRDSHLKRADEIIAKLARPPASSS